MSYNIETDVELFHPLTYGAPGAWWTASTAANDWRQGIVMVLAPCEEDQGNPLQIEREKWQVSWTKDGIRGDVAHGTTYAQALAALRSDCPWPTALKHVGAYVQAVHSGHPSAAGGFLGLVTS